MVFDVIPKQQKYSDTTVPGTTILAISQAKKAPNNLAILNLIKKGIFNMATRDN
jgi:hypothetical protein